VVAGGQQPTRHRNFLRIFIGVALGCLAAALVFTSGYLIGSSETTTQPSAIAAKFHQRAAQAMPIPADKHALKPNRPSDKHKTGRPPQQTKPELQRITVEDGDSLWGIAASIAPRADPQVMVSRIVKLNSLEESAGLEIGQRLTVPGTAKTSRDEPKAGRGERPGHRSTSPTGDVAPPVSVSIPRLELNQDLVELNVISGVLQVPTDYADIGWWRDGPSPGAPGSAVLVGHVDSPTGPAVFYGLSSIQVGDVVTVGREDGTKATFRVSDATLYPRESFPSSKVYSEHGRPTLTLLTCGGTYDATAGQYTGNLVVTAHPDNRKPR